MTHLHYVLLAYGISALVLIGLTLFTAISSRILAARLKQLEARTQAAQAKL